MNIVILIGVSIKLIIFFQLTKTIRAKLKQRVNENRSKQVTLGDIDSIMRNVVTIIQDEFMKRFPSGPTPAVTSTNSTFIKKN